MICNHPFYHLNVEGCLAKVPGTEAEWAQRVSGDGRGAENTLTRRGILEVCILNTALFQYKGKPLPDDQKMTLQTSQWEEPYPCKDRSLLINRLAYQLLMYEQEMSVWQDSRWEKYRLDATVGLMHVKTAVNTFNALRKTGKLSSNSPITEEEKTIERYFDRIRKVVMTVKADDYKRWARSRRRNIFDESVDEMKNALQWYGPKELTQEAAYWAIAEILTRLGVEKGTRTTVAKLIERRRQRKARQSQENHATSQDANDVAKGEARPEIIIVRPNDDQ